MATNSKPSKVWTPAAVARLTPDEYLEHRDDILKALVEGRIKRDRPYRGSVRQGDPL